MREVYGYVMKAAKLDADDKHDMDTSDIDELAKKHFKLYVYVDPKTSKARLIYR